MSLASLWQNFRPTRGKAFAIHLIISLLVFSSLVLMMILYWFPGKLFFLDGGWQGLKLVAMVDLVLGPALTLVLFKPGKPKLLLDMSMIAIVQLAALAYGFHTTYQQRTVAIVYAEKGFNTLSAKANQEADRDLRKLGEHPKPLPATALLTLPLLLTPLPEPDQFGKFLQDIFNGYPGPQERSDQYVRLSDNHDAIRDDALDEQRLSQLGALAAVKESLQEHGLNRDEVEFYRFKARYANGIAVFDPQTLRIVDYVTYEKPASNVDNLKNQQEPGQKQEQGPSLSAANPASNSSASAPVQSSPVLRQSD